MNNSVFILRVLFPAKIWPNWRSSKKSSRFWWHLIKKGHTFEVIVSLITFFEGIGIVISGVSPLWQKISAQGLIFFFFLLCEVRESTVSLIRSSFVKLSSTHLHSQTVRLGSRILMKVPPPHMSPGEVVKLVGLGSGINRAYPVQFSKYSDFHIW